MADKLWGQIEDVNAEIDIISDKLLDAMRAHHVGDWRKLDVQRQRLFRKRKNLIERRQHYIERLSARAK